MVSLGLTKVLGPTMVNEFHLSYLRDANNVGQPQGGVGPSLASQGFVDGSGNPSIYALAPQIEGIENVSFNDFTLGVDTTGLKEANNTFQVSENFSKVMGTHVLKVGGGIPHRPGQYQSRRHLTTARSHSRERKRDRTSRTFCWASPAAMRKGTPWRSIFATNTWGSMRRTVGG